MARFWGVAAIIGAALGGFLAVRALVPGGDGLAADVLVAGLLIAVTVLGVGLATVRNVLPQTLTVAGLVLVGALAAALALAHSAAFGS